MRRFLPQPLTALLVLLVAAVVGLGFLLWAQANAHPRSSTTSSSAKRTTAALTAARQAAIDLNSYDYRSIDQQYAVIQREVTGELAANFQQSKDKVKQQVVASKLVATSEVLEAAVVPDSGSGDGLSVLASLQTVYAAAGGTPRPQVQFVRIDMIRSGSGWLAANLQPIA